MATSGLESLSRFFGGLRWLFMPLGLFALVAVGVHAAADVVDDSILRGVEWLDAVFDGVLAKFEATAVWVNRVDSKERTVIARGFAFSWELCVDFFVALPALGYGEQDANERRFAVTRETWRTLMARLNHQPTPMRLIRPIVTAVFVFGGAYAVSRLVESTLFVGLVGDVAPADVSAWLARVAGGTAMTVVLFSHGWRAVLRALQHADAVCSRSKHPWWSGLWGSAFSLPLSVALVMEAGAVLSFFR